MRKHHFFNIEWINFPNNKNRKVKGCYLIGDCYVGASQNIRARILNHISSVYLVSRNEFLTYNIDSSEKNKYIYDCLVNNKPIKVTYISDDPMKEKEMYIKYNIPIKQNTVFYHQLYKKIKNGKR